MYKLKSLIFIIFLALVMTSCSTSPTGRSQMIWKSDAELVAQSTRAYNQMRSGMPLSTDRKKIDFVACVAEAVEGAGLVESRPGGHDLRAGLPAHGLDHSGILAVLRLQDTGSPPFNPGSRFGCQALYENPLTRLVYEVQCLLR